MKKLNFLLLMVLVFSGLSQVKAQAITQPTAGTEYYIASYSGGRLTFDGATASPKVQTFAGTPSQRFKFEAFPDGDITYYRIQETASNNYLYRPASNNWDLNWTADPDGLTDTDHALFQISIASDAEYVQLRSKTLNTARFKNDNGTVYADGWDNNSWTFWKLLAYAPDAVDKSLLDQYIAEASAFVGSNTAGTQVGEYPQNEFDALTSELAAAQVVLADADATQTTVDAQAAALQNALSICRLNKIIVLLDSDKAYHLKNYQNSLYLTNGATPANNVRTVVFTGTDEQQFKFHKTMIDGAPYYRIQQVSSGLYLCKSSANNWDNKLVTDPMDAVETGGTDRALFRIEESAAGYFLFRNKYNNNANTIGIESDNIVYYNKTTGTEARWQIIEFIPGLVDKDALVALITTANTFIATITAGTAPGEYNETAYDALLSEISDAELLRDDDNATQDDVNAMVSTLQAALNLLKSSENPVKPDVTKIYNIIHSSGQYMQPRTTGDSNSKAGVYAATGDTEQQFMFIPVDGQDGVYYILNVGQNQYLYRSSWEIQWIDNQPASNDGRFKIYIVQGSTENYVKFQSQSNTNYYWGTDNNSVGAGVSADKDGVNVLHHFNLQEVGTVPLITTSLENAITTAQEFYDDTQNEVGTEFGQYDPVKRSDLEAAILSAETLLQNIALTPENYTQDDINDELAALNTALNEYINSRNVPQFVPEALTNYRLFSKIGNIYMNSVNGTNDETLTLNTTGAFYQFEEVSGQPNVYLIKSSTGNYVYARSWTGDNGVADMKIRIDLTNDCYWTVEYAETVGEIHYFTFHNTNQNRYMSFYPNYEAGKVRSTTTLYDEENISSKIAIDEDNGPGTFNDDVNSLPVNIYSSSNTVYVKNMQGENVVSIYTMQGTMILSQECKSNEFTQTLPVGSYIVSVKGRTNKNIVVIVK